MKVQYVQYHLDHQVIPLQNKALTDEKRASEGSPLKYLRCWEIDYPYLGDGQTSHNRWLPIPENSPAQRLIRNATGTFGRK